MQIIIQDIINKESINNPVNSFNIRLSDSLNIKMVIDEVAILIEYRITKIQIIERILLVLKIYFKYSMLSQTATIKIKLIMSCSTVKSTIIKGRYSRGVM